MISPSSTTRRLARWACSFVALSYAVSGSVLAVDVVTKIDNATPQVAEPFWLTLAVQAVDGTNVIFPDVPDTIGPFNVLSHRDWFDVPAETHRTWTRHFQLESLQGGELQIPSITVAIDGQTLSSKAVSVSVTSRVEAEANTYAFRDIKPLIEIPPAPASDSGWIAWTAAGTLLATTLAFAVWSIYRKRDPSPGECALLKLEQLRGPDELEPDLAQTLLPQIADILRQYIERQFDIDATRQTTDEFLAKARHDTRLSESQQSLLQAFLEHVDEIKFSHLNPEEGRLDDSFRLVRNFVRSTSGDAK